ncbi:cupin domain-containing protein [Candidatus Hamiltonella defensa]|uniref:cupin domain-containing protein n=1 Tax=Candidatus Williamhamiltonella defendens TaxID=138072 RepID=UPI0020C615A3|nr:cupin domain-containing protein [Candidatus Hamiltonella defensa]
MHLIINWEDFLHHHWQKHPVLLKKSISDFMNPVPPEALEKLLTEKNLEYQLIQRRHRKCQLVHQSFNGYASLGQRNWSLRVEAIHHWHRTRRRIPVFVSCFPRLGQRRADGVFFSPRRGDWPTD